MNQHSAWGQQPPDLGSQGNQFGLPASSSQILNSPFEVQSLEDARRSQGIAWPSSASLPASASAFSTASSPASGFGSFSHPPLDSTQNPGKRSRHRKAAVSIPSAASGQHFDSAFASHQQQQQRRTRDELLSDSDPDSDVDDDTGLRDPNLVRYGARAMTPPDHASDRRGDNGGRRAPPRKRPHLDTEAVGRFANMGIFESSMITGPSSQRRRAGGNSSGNAWQSQEPLSSPPLEDLRAPPGSPAFASRSRAHTSEFSLDASATPVDDVTMGKGPSSWETGPHITYVHSLDDGDDGGGGEQRKGGSEISTQCPQNQSTRTGAEGERGDKATIPITREEAEELETFHRRRRDGDSSAHMHTEQGAAPSFKVNPELLAKLEAHSRAILFNGDMNRRRGSAPPSRDEAEGALILWKRPEELLGVGAGRHSGDAGETASDTRPLSPLPTNGRSNASTGTTSPVGMFAFGSTSPPRSFSPSFRNHFNAAAPTAGGGWSQNSVIASPLTSVITKAGEAGQRLDVTFGDAEAHGVAPAGTEVEMGMGMDMDMDMD